uniref:Uncharacterized protein n=1 Tax=Anguilla anguilla TaxID=7936 RepID=A0A0E9TG81_ANGAN
MGLDVRNRYLFSTSTSLSFQSWK